jgi:hypothetical protein
MNHRYCVLIFLALLALSNITAAVECTIAPDRMAVVDGERTFVLGLYENPKSDDVLADVAKAGVNLVRSGESKEALDRLEAQGLWAWLTTNSRIALNQDTEKRTKALGDMVANHADHPALMVWEVPDEALWNCWYGADQWRSGAEPKQLQELLDGLTDTDLEKRLRADYGRIGTLRRDGEYAEAEALADGLWVAVGKISPKAGYGLADAAERAADLCKGMVEGYQVLRKLDSKHPVWMNHAPRNQIAQLAAFNQGADIVGCDIYPVPRSKHQGHSDMAEKSAPAVGAYTLRMQAAAPNKPVWMVLQGFSWGVLNPDNAPHIVNELRHPYLEETRFMAFDAIIRGARGILYWGTYKADKEGVFWKELLIVLAELDALQPVLSAPDAKLTLTTTFEETYGSVESKVEVLPKAVDGKIWLLAVNEAPGPLDYTIHGLKGLNGQRYIEQYSGKEVVVTKETLRLKIARYGTHVLQPAPKK